jgi:hypothetical protein
LYVWFVDANSSQWVVANNSGSAAKLTIGDVAPPSPHAGDMWFDSVGAQTYVWFTDANSSQWVILNNFSGGAYLPKAGVTDGSNAPAGQIGEVISALVTAAVSLPNATQVNVATLALTPGDWDVQGECWIVVGSAAASIIQASISATSAVLASAVAMNTARTVNIGNFATGSTDVLPLGPCRINLSAAATYYLVGYVSSSGGTGITATGKIWARRAR